LIQSKALIEPSTLVQSGPGIEPLIDALVGSRTLISLRSRPTAAGTAGDGILAASRKREQILRLRNWLADVLISDGIGLRFCRSSRRFGPEIGRDQALLLGFE
jgi:hypothetical protein